MCSSSKVRGIASQSTFYITFALEKGEKTLLGYPALNGFNDSKASNVEAVKISLYNV